MWERRPHEEVWGQHSCTVHGLFHIGISDISNPLLEGRGEHMHRPLTSPSRLPSSNFSPLPPLAPTLVITSPPHFPPFPTTHGPLQISSWSDRVSTWTVLSHAYNTVED